MWNIPLGCLTNSLALRGAYLNATHELCEGIKDFLISASISYMIDPVSGACFVQYIMVIMMAYWTASVLHVQKERDE